MLLGHIVCSGFNFSITKINIESLYFFPQIRKHNTLNCDLIVFVCNAKSFIITILVFTFACNAKSIAIEVLGFSFFFSFFSFLSLVLDGLVKAI